MKKILKSIQFISLIAMTLFIVLLVVLISIPKTQKLILGTVGFGLTLYGFNELGPQISKSALNSRYKLTGNDYRAFSVQNTKNGNYALAINALENAISLDIKYKEYYGWVLLYYYRDYKRAYKILNDYDQLTPNFSDPVFGENVNYLKGLALLKMDRFQGAIDEFDIYINYVTNESGEKWVDVYAFVERGNAYLKKKMYQEAINNYDLAIANYANNTEAYFYKSIAYTKKDELDSALTSANKAYQLISKGYKHEDNYIEYFHEVYPAQVIRLMEEINEKLYLNN